MRAVMYSAVSRATNYNPHNRPTARNSLLACWRPIPRPSAVWSLAKPATEESQPHAGQFPDCADGERQTAGADKSPPAALDKARMPRPRQRLRKPRRDIRQKSNPSSAPQALARSSDCDVPRPESTDDLAPRAVDNHPIL